MDSQKKYYLSSALKLFFFLHPFLFLEPAMAATSAHAQYVGRFVCEGCHPKQVAQWSSSHHDRSMQLADEKTVLGDFRKANLTHKGITSYFYKKNGHFMVRTEGPDGKQQNYEIKYTFGIDPLQQYLIEFPGGRMQALNMAWDTRAKEAGGQRWFHLYPDEKITPDDELHWTKPGQNWNSVCAECHSTHLEKNYDPNTKTFSTTWSEINVSCEACHGAGSNHIAWAERKPGWGKLKERKGLALSLDERKNIHWTINPKTGNAARSKERSSSKEIEMCARCHSRRSPVSGHYVDGEPLLDHYRPRLLDEAIYYADGQINSEVYVYGSFLQSKMYHVGVTCSDCHDPHSLALKTAANGVCLQCHQATKYDKTQHHFHKLGSKGSSCTECHMPSRTYMVVDPRHDHSIRIPRPDLSIILGTPNACNNCHEDRKPEWAAKQMKIWYGHSPTGFQLYAQALHAAQNQLPEAEAQLELLIRNSETPDIARATALNQFGAYLNPSTVGLVKIGLLDDNPMVREAAVTALEYAPSDVRIPFTLPLLNDPVRAVRVETARILADVTAEKLTADQWVQLQDGLHSYIAAQQAMAERPEAQTNLGNLYAAQRKFDKAVLAYKTAVELSEGYVPAYINLADLYHIQGEEAEAEGILNKAIRVSPGNADAHYALGLSLARQKRTDEAIKALREAAVLNPGSARYVYVYAVALNSTGNPEQAIMVLQAAQSAHPNNVAILRALIAFNRNTGNLAAARRYAEKLEIISP